MVRTNPDPSVLFDHSHGGINSQRSLALATGNKMKSNLKVLCLALCMLPACLHASAIQDRNQACQSAELIPAGTIFPVSLNSTLRSDKSRGGATITATVLQDVPLGAGKTLRAGSKVTGHVLEASIAGRGFEESRISFQFDRVQFKNRTVLITTSLRAVASAMEVDAVGSWSAVELGSERVSYGEASGLLGSNQIGGAVGQEALAHISANIDRECGVVNGNSRVPALWPFSPDASGKYGLGDVQIVNSGRTEPAGEITLMTSNRRAVRVGRGSAMLLRVDSSRPDFGEKQSPPSRYGNMSGSD
jgi:hypothetical protein